MSKTEFTHQKNHPYSPYSEGVDHMQSLKKSNGFLKASENPIEEIEKVSYEGQDPRMKMYRSGYERYMNAMPEINMDDPFAEQKSKLTSQIMGDLRNDIKDAHWITSLNIPEEKGFNRTILGIAPARIDSDGLKEGATIVLAKWGDGKQSPVHGHSAGFIYEDILLGKMLVNTYRLVDKLEGVVRPVETKIVTNGVFASIFAKRNPDHVFPRQTLIHNFKSIGYSATLHYLPEFTRDGRDNTFTVEHFEDVVYMDVKDVTQVTGKEAMYSQPGDVIMVRSSNVPEYGDHFIVITGHPVMKEHGLRPQDVAIQTSPNAYSMLDLFEPTNGVTLLKLNEVAKHKFHEFHGIVVEGKSVTFPEAI